MDHATGERALIAAILRRAVEDARGQTVYDFDSGDCQQEARRFLLDQRRIAFFCELAGTDTATIYPSLLKAAGLQ